MDDQQYARAVEGLSPRRRAVFNALRSIAPAADEDLVEAMDGSRSEVLPRRRELVIRGLVRAVGTRPTARGGNTTIWGIVPAGEVEEARELAEAAGPRRQQIAKWDFEDRVAFARALLRDPKVNLALQETSAPGSRRARARAHEEIERARRERSDEVRREQAERGELVAFLKARNHLQSAVDAVREVGFFLEAEMERRDDERPALIPDGAWPQVMELLDEGARISDDLYDKIARHIGHEPRLGVQIIDSGTVESDAARPIKVINASAAEPAATVDGPQQPRT